MGQVNGLLRLTLACEKDGVGAMFFPFRDHNPSERTPYVTWAILIANIAIFLGYYLTFGGDPWALQSFFETWGLVPSQPSVLTAVSSMFLHGGWMHLAGNMLFLYVYGDNMEDQMGHIGFLMFYLLGGFAAAAAQYLADPSSTIPMVGASGAIAAVMGGYLLMFPKARVDVLFFIVIFVRIFPVPAWIVLGAWFGIQLVQGSVMPSDQGGVAYWAHAGGFAAGLLMAYPLWQKRGGIVFWRRTEGHPPHPEAQYRTVRTAVPRVSRRR